MKLPLICLIIDSLNMILKEYSRRKLKKPNRLRLKVKDILNNLTPKIRKVKIRLLNMKRSLVKSSNSKEKKSLNKASDSMRSKLLKSGRCPICTLAPPCKHYSDEDKIKEDYKKMIEPRSSPKKHSVDSSRSPQKSASKELQPNKVPLKSFRKSKNNHKLNKTVYASNRDYQNKLRNSKVSPRLNPLQSDEDDALPIIRDEDFEKIRGSQDLNKTDINEVSAYKNNDPKSVVRNSKYQPNANAIYSINRVRKSHRLNLNQQRLYSHQNRTKVRIQGKHGVRSEKFVDIQRSIQEQKIEEDQKRSILKSKQRHKIQERIERYREEKIQREIELLEEAKRLEQEERDREKAREDRRKRYLEKQRRKLDGYIKEKDKQK